jgi:uncharacterized protein (TIGR02118 family)
MIKVTVLYGHPVDPKAFDSYYLNEHLAIVAKMKEVLKAEITKFLPGPDGVNPPYYRMGELYFNNLEEFQASMASLEGSAAAADIANFASGGATMIVGEVDWTS